MLDVFQCGVKGEATLKDCQGCNDHQDKDGLRHVTIRVPWAAGDNVVATCAIYELQRQHPGKFAVSIRTHYPQIWENTPHIAGIEDATNDDDRHIGTRWLQLDAQPILNTSWHRPVHYLQAFTHDLAKQLNLPPLEISEFRGHVYLSEQEKHGNPLWDLPRPWWLINAGGKKDCTCKIWPQEHFAALVQQLKGKVHFVQIGALDTDSGGHVHPPLPDVVDMRGKTNHRQLAQLVYHADGVLCGNTYLMHLAAAVDNPPWRPWLRPCVVLAGGRESVNWFNYPGHTALHTIGQLECCAFSGCWRDRVELLGDGRPYDAADKRCHQPTDLGGKLAALAPRCLTMITPEEVAWTIEKYLGFNHTK